MKKSIFLPYGMSLEIILPPTVLFTVKELKFKGHDDTLNCVILCVALTRNKKNTTVQHMKTGFSPTKVGGIACCDHKMSSASSLSPYQGVCCTEHSPLALGAGHTSWHPRPPFSLSISVCLFFSVSLLPGCSDPPFPPAPPLPVTLRRSASIVSVLRPQCWQSSRPSEDTSNPVPPLCC